MEKPTELINFDFHNHPFNKGNLAVIPSDYPSWNPVNIQPFNIYDLDLDQCKDLHGEYEYLEQKFQEKSLTAFLNISLLLKQLFNSQSTLTDLKQASTLSITNLIAIEQAYAETWFIRCLLPLVSPLNGNLLQQVIHKRITYYALFKNELEQIKRSKDYTHFEVLKSIKDFKTNYLNIILSIEGAHSLQSDYDHPESIKSNLINLKNDKNYRFLYLTLTHLTRQRAAVHCFGTYIRKGLNFTPNILYQPDPKESGISDLGKEIINIAYSPDPYILLIDIKHMSYYSRTKFYELRDANPKLSSIPIVATHMGVTGCSFKDAKIENIHHGNILDIFHEKKCDRVKWVPVVSSINTRFNPWTINLYDEEIIKIIESKGLIGLNLDQRILGVGKFPGEYMSPIEVKLLDLNSPKRKGKDNTAAASITAAANENPGNDISPELLISQDLMFQLTEEEEKEEAEYMIGKNKRHIDYLASNIFHIIKVGFRKGFDGINNKINVCDCISIGSDFDGLMDPINFPTHKYGNDFNPKDFATASKMDRLKDELKDSFNRCIKVDTELNDYQKQGLIPKDLIEKVFVLNGWNFLDNHF